jgi:hypothetical protein
MNSEYDIDRAKKVNRGALADEGKRIVNNVRYTNYRHRDQVDESTGTYIMDCSGFISHVLKRVAPEHLGVIQKEIDELLPRACDFYEYFSMLTPEAGGCWRPIDSLHDVRRGDIMAWRYKGQIRPPDDTGHVLIVAETPDAQSDGNYSVRMHDSGNLRHNDDTRRGGVTGVGSGEIKFRVDSKRRPTSVQFKVGDSFYRCAVAVARAEPFIDVASNGPASVDKRLKDAAEQLDEARRDREQALNERAELDKRLKDATEQLEQARRDRKQALNERADLDKQLKDTTEQLEQARRDRKQALNERADLDKQLKDATEQLEQARRDREQALNERANMAKQLEQVADQLHQPRRNRTKR